MKDFAIALVIVFIIIGGTWAVFSVLPKKEVPEEVRIENAHNPYRIQITQIEGHLYLTGYKIGIVHAEHCPCKEEK